MKALKRVILFDMKISFEKNGLINISVSVTKRCISDPVIATISHLIRNETKTEKKLLDSIPKMLSKQ